ncbi:MAG: tRNA (adenosine(37)-N6)-threonylcarbamoyltransferase complex ATPase subunit type 1 TsaE [Actinomycetota bacterium]
MSGVLELSAPTPQTMQDLAASVASLLGGGDVVVLTGDLGAGKTTFVKGAAPALGVDEPVSSPTFTLVRRYRGTRPVHHVDVYRLDRIQDVLDLGLEDLFDSEGVTFVEWGDVIEGLLPDAYLEVELWTRPEDDGRLVVVTGHGRAWAERWERLETVLSPWAHAGEPT